ncbi:MAG: S8 family serine peptidase [Bdellovibrionales bacterium]|nr:S8 family serine peptidase [Bdellovibrionales bacterium]
MKIITATAIFLCCSLLNASESTDALMWYLKPSGQSIQVDIDDLHTETLIASPKLDWGFDTINSMPSNRPITIALIDGGIDIAHPELTEFLKFSKTDCLDGQIIPPQEEAIDHDSNGYSGDCVGWNFVSDNNRPDDEDGHGTHVAGIISSILKKHSNKIKIIPMKVFAPNETISSNDKLQPLSVRLEKSFEYALAKKVDVIHLSVGWPKDVMTRKLSDTIARALDSGITIIAASGNSAQSATPWPCRIEGIICVGALRPDGSIAQFSNRGSQVDFYAPGEKIFSTIPMSIPPLYYSKKGFDYKSGTSQAAPILTAVFSFLLSQDKKQNRDLVYEKLLHSADENLKSAGLRGLFHVDKALLSRSEETVWPVLKNLTQVTLDPHNNFSMSIKVVNFASASTRKFAFYTTCQDSSLQSHSGPTIELKKGESINVLISGTLQNTTLKHLPCSISIGKQTYNILPKLLHSLPTPEFSWKISQSTPIVLQRSVGAMSRLVTVPTVNNMNPQPIYTIAGEKELSLFYENKIIGTLPQSGECKRLRIWQADLNQNGKNDFIKESLCEKKHLLYEFYDENLQPIFEPIIYRPELCTINYDSFEVIAQKNTAPILKFINTGFTPKPESPWEDSTIRFDRHFFTLTPTHLDGVWHYQAHISENPKLWAKDLGLRYTPSYEVLHYIKGNLLVKIEGKTVWVDIDSQKASYANLDHLLWDGSGQQNVLGSEDVVVHLFITPYEYRGYIIGSHSLRFQQPDLHDPLMKAMAMIETPNGHRLILRTFAYLWFIDYDQSGKILTQEKLLIDRFDFLGMRDQLSTISQAYLNQNVALVVDGTRISTNYIDIMTKGYTQSWAIPDKCASQAPVEFKNALYLPIVCAETKDQFRMDWLKLGSR